MSFKLLLKFLRPDCGVFLSFVALACLAVFLSSPKLLGQTTIPGTQALLMEGDLSAQMVAGIDRFLMRMTDESVDQREQYWTRDFSSQEAYEKSLEPNRQRLRKVLGVVDERMSVTALELVATTSAPSLKAESDSCEVHAVRWQVLEGVYGEGLLLKTKGAIKGFVIAIPDADQTPEMVAGLAPGIPSNNQFARRLAEQGYEVVVPDLISRDDTWSGNESLNYFTNQPHREWIYRQAFEMGRHVIGYELQKILGLLDWYSAGSVGSDLNIGVCGYGEGGMLALCSGALDTRIDSTLVSGYFGKRESLWQEPIYRNVMGLLKEFGDAELAAMMAPRALVIEYSRQPIVEGPPEPRKGRKKGAAPGSLSRQAFVEVDAEFRRAQSLVKRSWSQAMILVHEDKDTTVGPGSEEALKRFQNGLGAEQGSLNSIGGSWENMSEFSSDARQKRQVQELVDYTQNLLRQAEYVREQTFWNELEADTPERWAQAVAPFKEDFWDTVIGRISMERQSLKPRSRLVKETDAWTCYEVVLDVFEDVYAWGYFLVPKTILPGEKRPVVVCQHGLEGLPEDTIDEDPSGRPWGFYHAYAARLAERGFVVFSPHNPYRGRDKFRVLQRKLNPLGLTLFSVITEQHNAILDFLCEQPFVDPERIALYGLSYEGKTAMRVPALLDRYALSICSADFNEWVKKNVTIDWSSSYVFKGEYEIFEFDLGETYNYAEMAAMIAPRPFMVERGHYDQVAPDEWVAYEYAKVRRLYAELGIPERTDIEFFNGPHTINGEGTFRFLHEHLDWPEPKL